MGGEKNVKMAPTVAAKYPQLAIRPVGKQITNIYTERLNQFTDNGQYREQGLMAKLDRGRKSGSPHVELYVWSAPDQSRPTFKEATREENEYKKTHKGESFGPSWSTHWFRVEFTIPEDWKKEPRIEFHWQTGAEGMVWTEDGNPLQGLSPGERKEWILPKSYLKVGKKQTIYVEMACNIMFGNPTGGDTIQPPDPNKYYTITEADLVSVNLDARALFYDFWIIGDAAREFPRDSWEQHKALQVCNEIMDVFIAGNGSDDALKDCRAVARKYIGDHVDSAKVYGNSNPALVEGIGHCHIDTCWLWPWAETKRKIARSWSSQCNLLEQYPEHRFCASQAQQYKWLEELYPYVFDRVKQHVKKGNFQPIGGSWVEHDTNLPSGESLVRQFLYGQRYFESRFGQRCTTFWLPDTFGYSAQLPQLCRLAGMNRFFTQKLSWNNINNFPHTTFNWVSLDGSQVICHMAPSETYTAEAHFGDVKRSISQHKSMDQDPSSLLVFGKGDGGGGPTFGHIEKLRRCRGISDKVGLLPRVNMGNSVEDFFDKLEHKAATGETNFVTWYGELYFELHRGTYTTQAANKRNNRKAEILLHDIEYMATLASIAGKKGYKYPKKEIDSMWENVLLCQFHDCLPGSSIEMCYDDSDKLYAEVFKTGDKVLADAMASLRFYQPQTPWRRDYVLTINTLGWNRQEAVYDEKKAREYTEAYHRPDTRKSRGFFSNPVKPYFYVPGRVTVQEIRAGVFQMKNEDYDIEIENGAITSLYDIKAKRQVVPKGSRSNQLVIFDDKPLYWQAWDVEVYHLDSRKELRGGESRIVTLDDGRIGVVTKTKISEKSSIEQTITISSINGPDQPSIVEIDAKVDWHETMKFLKVEFPTTVRNTEASYETQFGIIRRPTHYNTTWDMAKFEVCCHKWADLSEHTYGVSVLNDSKYGFATCGNVMRLSLLRAPKAPDAHADMKTHHIRWAIMPHTGPLDHRTVRAGYNFNYPMRYSPNEDPERAEELLRCFKLTPDSSPGLVVDTVKRGEDDEDIPSGDFVLPKSGRHVVIRVYDALGGQASGTISCGIICVRKAWKCNVLEDKLEEIPLRRDERELDIELRAFEVATYKVLLDYEER